MPSPKNNGLDPVVKDVLVYGGVALGGYYLIRKSFSWFGQTFGDAPPDEFKQFVKDKYTKYVEFIRDVLGPSINRKNLQFDRQFYKKAADVLYTAMNGAGTDDDLIFETLDGLNADDLKTIYMDFGLRAPTVDLYLTTVATGPRRDLIDWFLAEFSGSALRDIKKIWKPTHLLG